MLAISLSRQYCKVLDDLLIVASTSRRLCETFQRSDCGILRAKLQRYSRVRSGRIYLLASTLLDVGATRSLVAGRIRFRQIMRRFQNGRHLLPQRDLDQYRHLRLLLVLWEDAPYLLVTK